MQRQRRKLLELALAMPMAGRTIASAAVADPIEATMANIRPLFTRKLPARAGDWLSEHREAGQSYREFRVQVPKRAVDSFDRIRVVPVGPLSAGQQAVLDVTTAFLKPFFGLPLELDPAVPLASIPEDAQRVFTIAGARQLLTSYLLNDTLMKRRQPRDAAVLGITAMDLWPGAGWNFVFGQASLAERVGIWSMARNGDADGEPFMRRLCALRTVMTATHETGHMFGIRHCIAYECGMNGSNSAAERDRQPLEFCPECQGKLWWTLNVDPLARSRALESQAHQQKFDEAAGTFARQSRALYSGATPQNANDT